jgi:transcriptional regulator with XRE-family HTH domain
MSTTDVPAVARRRVRLALRNAREQKGLTQGQVANEMDWSLSKVMRIENGEVSISTGDLRMLLPYLGITGGPEVDQLLADAKASRRQRWVVEQEYREHLSSAMVELMQLETEATALRYFNPIILPGILQIPEYASAIFRNYGTLMTDIDESAMKVRMEARLARRERILDRRRPPDFLAILDESVLHRIIGGREVMDKQLRELLTIMRKSNIWIRILPFSSGGANALLGPFIILEMDDEQEAVLYREDPMGDQIARSRREIIQHRDIFERLWSVASGAEESARLIEERATLLKTAGA